MDPQQAIEFILNLPQLQSDQKVYLILPLDDLSNAEFKLSKIKELGYAAMIQQTAMGIEIVVTEKLPHQ